ncbi:MAG: DUF1848 domain-containing protein [Bacilli bacterium]|nr:DUF1848 domain-containing protein [Bacilli bacterium]
MILNVSGRTDIVAFYTKWFITRYKEGFFDVRNPFFPKNISRIYIEDIDAIMFCTKNPIPIIPHLKEINKPILFHITLTPYKRDIEPNVLPKGKIIEAIKKISKIVGIDNIYIRYDPIFLNDKYNINYHIKAFDHMCKLLDGHIKHIIISFIDDYKNVRKNMNILKIKNFTEEDYKKIGINFSKSAKNHGMTVQTCAEKRNLTEYGFIKNDCLSKELAKKITGKTFKKWQGRKGKCNCVEMVDIGAYNTCLHLCKYCYANYDENSIKDNTKKHSFNSSLLLGKIENDDIIKIRR